MPPGAIGKRLEHDTLANETSDSILDSRKKIIEELLDVCHKLFDRYTVLKRVCVGYEKAESCDSLVLGSLLRQLVCIGL